MSSRATTLTVFLGERPVAELEDRRGRAQLRYLPEIVDSDAGQPLLSCSLRVQRKVHDATNFFDGVLPEGQFRAALAARASISSSNTFGMLRRYGRDVAGAVVVSDGTANDSRQPHVLPLGPAELEDEVAALPEQPLGVHDDSELSIAGLQNKLLLVRMADGRWGRPAGGAPSTHILKVDSQAHPGVVAAEASAMKLARAIGLTTVDVELATFGGVSCLIVERFDREVVGGQVRRLHQEDTCQALGLPAVRKYELPGRGNERRGGGPEFSRIATLLDEHAANQNRELEQLARVMAFTALIGNADAHGKNLALLHLEPGVITLAPVYDQVPTALFPRLKADAAMTIGGTVDLGRVTPSTIAAEVAHWQWDRERAVDAALDVAGQLLSTLDGNDLDLLESVTGLVRERCERFLAHRTV